MIFNVELNGLYDMPTMQMDIEQKVLDKAYKLFCLSFLDVPIFSLKNRTFQNKKDPKKLSSYTQIIFLFLSFTFFPSSRDINFYLVVSPPLLT